MNQTTTTDGTDGTNTGTDTGFSDWLVNPDHPDALVPVAAGELFQWAGLVAELADWLDHAAQTTRFDLHRHFHGVRSAEATAGSLAHIRERIAALLASLDGDRSQP